MRPGDTSTVGSEQPSPPDDGALLSVDRLRTVFHTREGTLVAVDDVSFDVRRGEVFSIVGESGSGKSVTAMSILGIVGAPGEIDGGSIMFDGRDLLSLTPKQMRSVRGSEISMIFQDPMTALNPVYTIGDQVGEPLRTHRGYSRKEAMEAAVDALRKVGIPDPEKRVRDHPHEFSGGMRQRAMIAMAMITEPKLLIADEPTTALDVTIQAQILELLLEISQTQGTSVMLISHDLGVVASVSDRMMVMYGGQVHESGTSDQVFDDAHGPYTWGLLASIPRLDSRLGQTLAHIRGQPPSLVDLPEACRFEPRCGHARDLCAERVPDVLQLGDGHIVRCHFASEQGWRERRGAGQEGGERIA